MNEPLRAADDMMTTIEAAEFLRVSKETMERWRGTGGDYPRFHKYPGKRGRVTYRRSDLEAWLNGRNVGNTSQYGR